MYIILCLEWKTMYIIHEFSNNDDNNNKVYKTINKQTILLITMCRSVLNLVSALHGRVCIIISQQTCLNTI